MKYKVGDIEVGEYVRTRGIIGKLLRIEYDKNDTSLKWYVLDRGINVEDYQICYVNKPYIEKHSKDIEDLIEANDIVNGMYIETFFDEDEEEYLGVPIYTDALMNRIEEVLPLSHMKIETVVTHEQIERVKYKVVD